MPLKFKIIWIRICLVIRLWNDNNVSDGLVWFVGFYGISTFVGYLTPNPFLFE